jgi:hypothetical protein
MSTAKKRVQSIRGRARSSVLLRPGVIFSRELPSTLALARAVVSTEQERRTWQNFRMKEKPAQAGDQFRTDNQQENCDCMTTKPGMCGIISDFFCPFYLAPVQLAPAQHRALKYYDQLVWVMEDPTFVRSPGNFQSRLNLCCGAPVLI